MKKDLGKGFPNRPTNKTVRQKTQTALTECAHKSPFMKPTLKTARSLTAAIITFGSLVGGAEASVTWLVSDDGTDLTFATDGGSLSYTGTSSTLVGFGASPGDATVGTARFAVTPSDDSLTGIGVGITALDPTMNANTIARISGAGARSAFTPGIFNMTLSGTTIGTTFGFNRDNLLLPIGSALSGTATPITSFVIPGETVASVFGTELDAGPVVLWSSNSSSDVIAIGFSSIPEPSSVFLLGLGSLGFMLRRSRC